MSLGDRKIPVITLQELGIQSYQLASPVRPMIVGTVVTPQPTPKFIPQPTAQYIVQVPKILEPVPEIPPEPKTQLIEVPNPLELPTAGVSPVCPLLEFENVLDNLPWLFSEPPLPKDPSSIYGVLSCLGDGNCLFHCFLRAVSPIYIDSYEIPDIIPEEEIRRFEEEINSFLNFPPGTLDPPRGKSSQYQILDKKRYAETMSKFRIQYACDFRNQMSKFILLDLSVREIVKQFFPSALEIEEDMIKESYPELPEDQVSLYALGNVLNDISTRINQTGFAIEPDILILLSELYEYDIYVLSESALLNPISEHPFPAGHLLAAVRGPPSLRRPDDPFINTPERSSIVLLHIGGVEGHYDLIVRSDFDGKIVSVFSGDEPLIQTLYTYAVANR